MAGILNIATSGLNAFQSALDTIGNNIANVNTEGYSRQSLELNTRTSQRFGSVYIGGGVNLESVRRISDSFAAIQVRDTLALFSEFNTLHSNSLQMDQLLSQDGTSISKSLQEFFSALEKVNEAPDSSATRNVMLNQANILAEQFVSMQNQVEEFRSNLRVQVSQAVSEINSIAKNIADINSKIANGVNTPPELLDQRDNLLKELSKFTQVRATQQTDGTVNVSIGSGEAIVIGTQSRSLSVGLSTDGRAKTDVFIESSTSQISIKQNLKGGMLGGIFEFENEVLDKTSQLIGQMSIGLALDFNQQHRLGVDLNGQLGKDFFTDYNSATLQASRVFANAANTGSAQLSVSIDDIGQTELTDYELVITGANTAQVKNITNGSLSNVTFTDTPPTPPSAAISFDGMTITVDDLGLFNTGDSFIIKPTEGAAAFFKTEINDPREIAFAAPVRTSASLSNTGQGNIELLQISDINSADLNKEYRIDFISASQYNVVNVTDSSTTGPFAFTPNANNTVSIPNAGTPAYTINLSGIPQAGDSFSSEFNAGGIGDNRNGFELSGLQTKKSFKAGTESVFDRYSQLISDIGSKTRQAQLRQESADILHKQAVDRRDSISGVNLDEEAANLLRFQQAYQAATQLIVVTNRMMDVLFNSFR
jgi:flagellar hook-associated protein 1 FlgK